MRTADDHEVGGLTHDRPCPSCGHDAHYARCGADVVVDSGVELVDVVTCPCRCPVPGIHPKALGG